MKDIINQWNSAASKYVEEDFAIGMDGSGEIHTKMWKEILKKQLQVTQEYFNSKI